MIIDICFNTFSVIHFVQFNLIFLHFHISVRVQKTEDVGVTYHITAWNTNMAVVSNCEHVILYVSILSEYRSGTCISKVYWQILTNTASRLEDVTTERHW